MEQGFQLNSSGGLLGDLIRPPSRRFVIDTGLSEAEIAGRLRGIVEPRNPFLASFGRTNKLFAGEVSPQGFKIMRLIYYGNSSLPVVIGRFEPGPRGARVQVTMRPTRFASAFGTLWLAAAAIFTVVAGLATIFSWPRNAAVSGGIFTLGGVAAIAFGYLIMAVPFGAEARKAQGLLEETLQATPGPRIQKVLASAPPRLPRFAKFLLAVGAAAIILSVVMMVVMPAFIVRSEPHHIAERYIRLDPVVQAELGPIRGIDFERWGYNLSYAGPEGSAKFALRVEGTHGKGTALVAMRRHLGVWQVCAANLREPSGRTVILRAVTTAAATAPCP